MSVRKACLFFTLLIASCTKCEGNGTIVKQYNVKSLDLNLEDQPLQKYPLSSWDQCSYLCTADEQCHAFTLSDETQDLGATECNLWTLPKYIAMRSHLSGDLFFDISIYAPMEAVLALQTLYRYRNKTVLHTSPFSSTSYLEVSLDEGKKFFYDPPDQEVPPAYSYGGLDENFGVFCNADGLLFCDVWDIQDTSRKPNRYAYTLDPAITDQGDTLGFALHRGLVWVVSNPNIISILNLDSGTWSVALFAFPCDFYKGKAFPISDTEVLIPGGRGFLQSTLRSETWILKYPTGEELGVYDSGCPMNPLMTMTCDLLSEIQVICFGTARTDGFLDSEEGILATFSLETKEWQYEQHELFNRNRAVYVYDMKALLLDIIEPELKSKNPLSYYSDKAHLVYDAESGEVQELPQLGTFRVYNPILRACTPMCPFRVKYVENVMKRS